MAWTLTVGQTDLTAYVLPGAAFTEIASSADGSGLFAVNGSHADLAEGNPVVVTSAGVTIWEGTIASAAVQTNADGVAIATLVCAQPLAAQTTVGLMSGSYQDNDVAVLAAQVASATPLPWNGPASLGVLVGALTFTRADDALGVLSTLADATWRVQAGALRFVAAKDGLTNIATPLLGNSNAISALDLLGGADAQTRVPLATRTTPAGSPAGPVCYVAQAEIADTGTLERFARVLADRYGSGAIAGTTTLPNATLRAGDWIVDPNGVTAVAYQTRYELAAGLLQLRVQFGFPALPTNPQYAAEFADAMHRTPVARVHTDYVVSGCDISVNGTSVTVAAGSVNIGGTVYALSAATFTVSANQTASLIATPTGFALIASTVPPTPGTGVLLYVVTAAQTTLTQQRDVRAHGGIGNHNLKPANPNNTPSIAEGEITLAAEGMTAAKATIPFTINGLTLDDTIGSIEVVQSLAGENQWGNAHTLEWSPGATSFTDYRHGLSAAQSYDLAVNILGRDGKPLNASPLLIGTSPTISSAAIGIALNLDEVPDGPSGLRNAVSSVDSNHRALVDPTQSGHVGGALTDASGAALHTRMSAAYQGNFGSAGDMLSSTLFNDGVPNSSAFFQDFMWEWSYTYDSGTNSYTFTIWYDNGTADDDTFAYLPNYETTPGDRDINLGHTTSASPSISGFVVPSGSSLYLLGYYKAGVGMTVQASTSPFTAAQLRTSVQDGGYLCAFATVGTGSVFKPSGTTGGIGSAAGNGGRLPPVN